MVDSRRQAEFQVKEFYARLRRMIRKYQPIEFSLAAAQIINMVLETPLRQTRYPIHFLLHAVEANCAYHDKYVDTKELTQARFDELIEFYKRYNDPYILYVLETETDLSSFAFAMARQQFAYQQFGDYGYALVRATHLFDQGQPMPRIHTLFQSNYGLNIPSWILMCFAVLTDTQLKNSPLTMTARYYDFADRSNLLPSSAVVPFLEMASLSPNKIGERFRELRESLASHLHIFLQSVFLEHPLIAFGQDRFVSPHPGLLYHFSLDGLYRACQKLDPNIFSQEFGRSFEVYVGKVLAELGSECQVLPESSVQASSGGRVCDYVIVYKDTIMLVECKGVRYAATLTTEAAIRGDNSTTKLADSLEQISDTALRIRDGEFDHLFDKSNKRFMSATVTFGHIYFANSPNYIRQFILPKASFAAPERWPAALDYDPQVIPIDTFERMIAVLKSTKLSPVALLNAKLAKEGDAVGDWDTYIYGEYQTQDIDWHLDFAKETYKDLFTKPT